MKFIFMASRFRTKLCEVYSLFQTYCCIHIYFLPVEQWQGGKTVIEDQTESQGASKIRQP